MPLAESDVEVEVGFKFALCPCQGFACSSLVLDWAQFEQRSERKEAFVGLCGGGGGKLLS